MSMFAKKILDARVAKNMSQVQLADMAGLTSRSIQAYELGEKKPRATTLLRLAKALDVSTNYLINDNCTDPLEDIEKDVYLEQAHNRYDSSGEKEIRELLEAIKALFACENLPQEQKDAFFEAVMRSYIFCKEAQKQKENVVQCPQKAGQSRTRSEYAARTDETAR